MKYKVKYYLINKRQMLRNGVEFTYNDYMREIKRNGLFLQHMKEQTDEICLIAVNNDGLALKYVKEQTEEICTEAVKENGLAIQYVKEIFMKTVKFYI